MLNKAKQRTERVYHCQEYAQPCDRVKVYAGGQAVRHQRRHIADLVGADYRHDCAQRRQHQRKQHNSDAGAHVFFKPGRGITDAALLLLFAISHHHSAFLLPYASSDALSWDMAISRYTSQFFISSS